MAEKNNPFDFVDAVSFTKVDLFKEGREEKDYVPYLVNRALSNFPDSILYSNEMNVWSGLPRRLQHDYLMASLRKRSRRSGWSKPQELDLVRALSRALNLSPKKARVALSVLGRERAEAIRDSLPPEA